MKKICVLSEDNNLVNSFKNYYKDSSFYNVILYKENDDINTINYDLIIIDYFMYKKDNYDYLTNIKGDSYIFIILPNLRINMYPVLKDITINYLFYKPVSMPYIEHIMNMFFYNGITNIDSFRNEIITIFNELGLSFKLLGTKYIFDILLLILCERKEIDTNLYQIIGIKYNQSENNVIKDISYAISTCFNKGGNEDIKRTIFGYCYSDKTGSITNLNFINCIYLYIIYNSNEKELMYKKRTN